MKFKNKIKQYFSSFSTQLSLFSGLLFYSCYALAHAQAKNLYLIGVSVFVAFFLPFFSRISNKIEEKLQFHSAMITIGRLGRFAFQFLFNLGIFYMSVSPNKLRKEQKREYLRDSAKEEDKARRRAGKNPRFSIEQLGEARSQLPDTGAELIDFEKLLEPLEGLYSSRGSKGEPLIRGFKGLLLQFWEDLSDRQLENYLRENLSAKWFCRYGLEEETPDHSYFGKLRKRIVTMLKK